MSKSVAKFLTVIGTLMILTSMFGFGALLASSGIEKISDIAALASKRSSWVLASMLVIGSYLMCIYEVWLEERVRHLEKALYLSNSPPPQELLKFKRSEAMQ